MDKLVPTFGQAAHERPQMVRLLVLALANLDHILEILLDLTKQLAADAAFAGEQAMKRILVLARLLRQRIEFLFAV